MTAKNPLDTKLIFHYDSGHGWLEVPYWIIDLIEGLKVSPYSYACNRRQRGYLEEDCDKSAFINAFEKQFGAKPQMERKYSENSFVRSLNSYGYTRERETKNK